MDTLADGSEKSSGKVILFSNTDWYLYNFRLPLALRLREDGHEVVFISPPGQYASKLQDLGFRWHGVPMRRRSLNPVRELLLIAWLARFFSRERPAVVHGFTIKGAVYGSLAAKLAGVPVRVNSIDGLGYVFTSNQFRARLLRPLVRRVMRSAFNGRSSAVILQNADDIALFKEARIGGDRTLKLIRGVGVNCARFIPRRESDLQPTAPLRVLLAARLIWEKGIAEYVEAAQLLKEENRSIKFFLAGSPDEGNPAAVSKVLVESWVRHGLVEWLGHVSDMPALLSEIDVVVLPSYYREGLPTTLVEGAACALPLVTTDSPGCREVVSCNGTDGLTVPVRDSRSLANAIRLLDDDRALCRRLGLAAREKALREFDETVVLAKILTVYDELGLEATVAGRPHYTSTGR